MGVMRRRVLQAWLLGAVFGALACSGSSGTSVGGGSSSGGSSNGGGSGSGSSGGTAGDDAAGVPGDDAASSSSSSGGATLNTSGWVCPFDTVLGGYSPGCVSCIEAMCSTQLQQCVTSSCTSCEGPVFSCETQSCQSACAPGSSGGDAGGSSGSPAGDGGGSTGSCAGLMKCCAIVSTFDSMLGASCTAVAQSNNETSCQQTVAALPSTVSPYCM